MQPTSIGQKTTVVPTVSTELATAPPTQALTITLTPEMQVAVKEELRKLDFTTMPGSQIITIGQVAEMNLAKILDGFLSGLDKKRAAKTFELFGRLEKGVADADLPNVVAAVKAGPQPGAISSFFKKMTGKTETELMKEAWEKIQNLVTGKTTNLQDVMTGMEKELEKEMQALLGDLRNLDKLKQQYGDRITEFAIAAAVAQAFLAQATQYVAAEEARLANTTDPHERARLMELQSKLELLKSRALALEGTWTKMPADRLVIQQIEQAGVATFMETLTTASQRFSSIKLTLITIHGVFSVQSVQALGAKSLQMDNQLTSLRGGLLKEAATTAANAPGNNRLAQAAQIEAMIRDFTEVNAIVKQARVDNERKFDEARGRFATARDVLNTLSNN